MVMTDPIADMLTRIRNALVVKHESIDMPASNIKAAIADILVEEGFIKGYTRVEDGKQGILKIELKYGPNGERVITGLKRISKPGLRVYVRKDQCLRCWEDWDCNPINIKRCYNRQKGPTRRGWRRSPLLRLVRMTNI